MWRATCISRTARSTRPSDFTPPAAALTAEQIDYLKSVDSPTVANAVEAFNLRDRTAGFIGGAVKSLFTDLGVMVGQALTVTVANPSGPVPSNFRTASLASSLMRGPTAAATSLIPERVDRVEP